MDKKKIPWVVFFNRPALWAWALATIIGVVIATLIFCPTLQKTIDGHVSIFGTDYAEEKISSSWLLKEGGVIPGGALLYLTNWGVRFTEESIGTMDIKSNGGTLSLVVILLFFLGVIIITRESNSSIYILGPLITYSVLIIVYLAVTLVYFAPPDTKIAFIWLPTLISLLFWLIVMGVLARTIIRSAKKFKLIEGGLDDSFSDKPIRFAASVNKVVSDTTGRIATSLKPAIPIPAENSNPAEDTENKGAIGHDANYCPYCGSLEKDLKKGRKYCVCPICNSKNFGVFPKEGNDNGKQCPNCSAGILKGAHFCWRCGTLLENQEAEGQTEESQNGFCPGCGSKIIKVDDKFCAKCGAPLSG